jgi:hypothetical protein
MDARRSGDAAEAFAQIPRVRFLEVLLKARVRLGAASPDTRRGRAGSRLGEAGRGTAVDGDPAGTTVRAKKVFLSRDISPSVRSAPKPLYGNRTGASGSSNSVL